MVLAIPMGVVIAVATKGRGHIVWSIPNCVTACLRMFDIDSIGWISYIGKDFKQERNDVTVRR